MDRDAIPVTVLAGSLGAGKTTLLNRLLEDAGGRDVAVLVNDVGEINVDADLVSSRSDLSAGNVTELSNGCICCELRDDLETAVVGLARRRDFDHLVVEASGISEPGPVTRLFTTGSSAAALYEVDAVVTVVDSRLFFDTFAGEGAPEDRIAAATRAGDGDGDAGAAGANDPADGDADARPIAELLVEQVETASVVFLNKADLVDDDELDAVTDLVAALRPDADVVRTVHSDAPRDRVLGVGPYDPATAAENAGWRRVLDGADESARGRDGHAHDGHDHDHATPEERYGVTSFAYRARRPFHPGRLESLLSDLPESVMRAKGTLWVAGREETHLTLGAAGPSVRVEGAGRWIASLPAFERDAYRRNRSNLTWDDEWGDRRVELVFIGRGVDEASLRARLDECLLTDAEMREDWTAFDNPFPETPDGELAVTEPSGRA